VTLWLLALWIACAVTQAEEPQTILTANGQRFEKARVTELTPAMITIVHSAGVARMPLWELAPEFQRKFGYDEAKARAWLAQQAQIAAEAERQRQEAAKRNIERYGQTKAELQKMQRVLNAVYDQATGQWYASEEEAAAAREAALKRAYEAKAARPK